MERDSRSGTYKLCIPLDPFNTWQFKFVVDGQWRCSMEYPIVPDGHGNMNNILYPEERRP